MTGYLYFARANGRFLAFGLLLVLCSSFGQTYFVALFGADLRAAFDLSHGELGALYSLGTLASAGILIWLGRLIDQIDLRLYSTLVCAGLAAASLLLAVTPSVLVLGVAFFALRLFGQGLMIHTAYTSMARTFTAGRGKAISVAGLGMPLGEATLPLLAVGLAAAIGWRQSWLAFGLTLALVVLPLSRWLLRGHQDQHEAGGKAGSFDGQRQWSRTEVLRDPGFYVVLTSLLAPSFIITGLFFHQPHVAASKGWSLSLLATGFIAYAAASVLAALVGGQLVDRFSARRLVPYFLLPLCVALVILATFSHPAAAFFYLAAAGLNAGLAVAIVGAIWAELYGVAHIGSIRAIAMPAMVLASALSPVTLGWLIDAGVDLETIVWSCMAYCVAASVLVATASPGTKRPMTSPQHHPA